MTLVPVTPPQPIVGAAEARARVSALASLDDFAVNSLLQVAVEDVQESLGRALGLQTWDYRLSGDWGDYPGWLTCPRYAYPYIEIPLLPLRSVVSVTYLDEAGDPVTWPADEYRVSGIGDLWHRGRIRLANGFSWPTLQPYEEALTIRFTAGYEEVPAPLVQAVLLTAAEQATLSSTSASSGTGGLRRVIVNDVGSREYYQETTTSGGASGSKLSTAVERLVNKFRVYA